MHRAVAAPLLTLLTLLLPACGDKEGGTGTTEKPDTLVSDDDDILTWESIWSVERVLDMTPATLPEEGGVVKITLAASGKTSDGSAASTDEILAATLFSAALDDGTPLEVQAEAAGDDQLILTVTVPAGLAPGRHVLQEWVGDTAVPPQPLLGHAELSEGLAALEGTRAAVIPAPAMEEVCSWALADSDADGTAELLMVGIDQDCGLVYSTCTGFLEEGAEDWRCEDTCLDMKTKEGEDLLCGDTDHFRFAEGGAGSVTVVPTSEGRLLASPVWDWSSGTWTGTGETTELMSSGIFAIVLAINTTKEKESPPVSALLSIRVLGGRWDGQYSDGGKVYSWSSLSGVSVDSIAAGKAWAGLFTASGLSGGAGPDTAWAWVLDPALASRGSLSLGISAWSSGAGAFARVRDVTLSAPDFDIEQVYAVGEDLDGDGHPELLVEAWGEGQHAAWVVPAATNKASVVPVRTLLASGDSQGTLAFTDTPTTLTINGGNFELHDNSSFRLSGDGGLVAFSDHLRADLSGTPIQLLRTVTAWDLDEVIAKDAVEVEPVSEGLSSASDTTGGWAEVSALGVGNGTCSGRGVCHMGRCFCQAGWQGRPAAVLGGGVGSKLPWVGLAPGDLAQLGEDIGGGELILTRVPDPTAVSVALPLLAVDDGAGGVALVEGAFGASGPVVRVAGKDTMPWSVGSPVAMVADNGGRKAHFQWVWTSSVSRAQGVKVPTLSWFDGMVSFDGKTSGRLALPEDTTAGGCTAPTLLSPTLSAEGGVLLGWRDGGGQAWLGVLDVASAAAQAEGTLPFLQGPVAVGAPLVDADGMLGLGGAFAGMVGLDARGGVLGDDPLLDIGLETRDLGWDEAQTRAWTPLDVDYGPAVMTVGNGGGYDETVYIQAFSDIASLKVSPLHTGLKPEALPVPRLVAHIFPDAPPVVVSASAEGQITIDLVDGTGPLAQQLAYAKGNPNFAGGISVASGDLNGDGLSDLLLPAGVGTLVFPSDGRGGTLPDTVEARPFTNFAVLLGGSNAGDECRVSADGGTAGLTRGRALYGLEVLGE